MHLVTNNVPFMIPFLWKQRITSCENTEFPDSI